MANEKSRNHEPRGSTKGESGKAQGKPDADTQKKAASKRRAGSSSGKPGPGKQPRDQLSIRKSASSPAKGE